MKKMIVSKNMLNSAITALLLTSCSVAEPLAPYGAVPNKQQVDWQKLEYYMFIHFGPNTFTNVEWGNGKEDPKVFNPTHLDCRQWASIAKDAGMKAIILTAKHHDGFCLWPSKYSTHTVRETPWKDGKGDVLKELSEACREYGLKFGVYLSPWDQNHPSYGTPQYSQVFVNTLTEVLTQYGEVFEQWFDGANGLAQNGYKPEYDWNMINGTVYKHQPQILIFSDIGPDVRWMGNERGVAGETNWSTLNTEGFGPGEAAPPRAILSSGNMNGEKWIPAEVDVSIRPKWFYTAKQDGAVKSLAQLTDIYYTSVGRNANLLLNVPPNREGRIHPIDSARLMEFRKVIDESFADNLIKGAKLKATNTRGNASRYGVKYLMDKNFDSYWATDDSVKNVSIEITLPEAKSFNRFLAQEYIPLGQRVAKFSVDVWNNRAKVWEKLAEGTTIGYKRILRFPEVTAQKIRFNIDESLAAPVLSDIGLYKAVEVVDNNKENNGQVTIAPKKWKLLSPVNALEVIDGNAENKAFIDKATPIIIDLGEKLMLKGFVYTPEAKTDAPNIYEYTFSVSLDGKQWTSLRKAARFNNIQNNPIPQEVLFDQPVSAQYIKLETIETANPGKQYVVNEISVISE